MIHHCNIDNGDYNTYADLLEFMVLWIVVTEEAAEQVSSQKDRTTQRDVFSTEMDRSIALADKVTALETALLKFNAQRDAMKILEKKMADKVAREKKKAAKAGNKK